ncbi:hypothetical protein BG74_01620 [Sodalis-like endosymbiont of Proechinophthirus fluctus]|nr:hypothetical protein BG74_01620 [Sodalis-like endosymbiont of Proechinophthirus fluctus]
MTERKETAAMITIYSGIEEDMLMMILSIMDSRDLNINRYDADSHSVITNRIFYSRNFCSEKLLIWVLISMIFLHHGMLIVGGTKK